MTKQFTLMELFSIVDGRLSNAGMDSVYKVLGHICKFDEIMTHHLPTAKAYIDELKPDWYLQIQKAIEHAKEIAGNEFPALMQYIEKNNLTWDIPQIEDETAFGKYMVDNSLVLKIGSKV